MLKISVFLFDFSNQFLVASDFYQIFIKFTLLFYLFNGLLSALTLTVFNIQGFKMT